MRYCQGHSLLEVLVTLTLIAGLGGYAIENYHRWLVQLEALEVENRLFSSIQFARLTAMTEATWIGICGVNSFGECQKDFSLGWKIFRVEGGNILEQVSWSHPRGTLLWKAFHAENALYFNKTGESPYQNGRFLYFIPGDELAHWQYTLNRIGRLSEEH